MSWAFYFTRVSYGSSKYRLPLFTLGTIFFLFAAQLYF